MATITRLVKFNGKPVNVRAEIGTPRAKKDAALFRLSKAMAKLKMSKAIVEGYKVYKLKTTIPDVGESIQVDKLAVGGLCLTTVEPVLPVPDGTYNLVTGQALTIGKGGVITKVEANKSNLK